MNGNELKMMIDPILKHVLDLQAICGIEIDSIEEGIEEGWIPYFYEGDKEHEFACPGCSEIFLQVGKDKEMEVKEEYRGKIKYLDEKPEEHPAMWVMFK